MIAVCVTFHVHPNEGEAFLALVVNNARTSRRIEPGCLLFDVCRAGDEVFLYEIYGDRAAFDAHLARAHFKAFDAATADMVASKSVKIFDEVVR